MSTADPGSGSPPLHSVSVAGAVVREDGRVPVIRRADNGRWEPPGGVLELSESPEAGARREVLEETGIEVEVQRLTGVYKNMARGVVALVFRCTPVGGSERTSEESAAVSWMALEEATAVMSEAHAVRLLDAFSDDAPHVRIHDGRRLTPA
ncbi:NUDIX domain-containing protein [Streptomyces sp. VNUA116]|uniref:NUDIX hydrolase n=1 Tax=Streptomyces sp. VNUA116 TaxID=3062449 RepID=UPI0026769388|nr:NUDIX domain-containing protein [Streptomyces sp. VNUA116]WKU44651.1 NUDIX domain-containing protein [Streptomyces sp. VNUA116]